MEAGKIAKLRASLSKRADMDIIGNDYQQERSFNVMDKMAENVGHGQSGSMMDLGIGAGVGFGVGGGLGEKFGQMGKQLKFDKEEKQQPSQSEQPKQQEGVSHDEEA